MPKPNELICGDTIYEMSPAYIDGAKAMRANCSHWSNPHSDESQEYSDWDYGHSNESTGEHIRFGKDLIKEIPEGKTFDEDPNVPRDEFGDVSSDWIEKQAAALA